MQTQTQTETQHAADRRRGVDRAEAGPPDIGAVEAAFVSCSPLGKAVIDGLCGARCQLFLDLDGFFFPPSFFFYRVFFSYLQRLEGAKDVTSGGRCCSTRGDGVMLAHLRVTSGSGCGSGPWV